MVHICTTNPQRVNVGCSDNAAGGSKGFCWLVCYWYEGAVSESSGMLTNKLSKNIHV